MKTKNILVPFTLASALLTGGCATIIGDPTQTMAVGSTPGDASILITDEKGHEVFKGSTPTTVTLAKSDGSYWGKKTYTVVISKEGYKTQTVPITANANGWYMFGNLVFGGLIGYFIVDPLNGDMYTLSPKDVNSSLGAETANNNTSEDSIRVVLLDDVPAELRSKMRRLGS